MTNGEKEVLLSARKALEMATDRIAQGESWYDLSEVSHAELMDIVDNAMRGLKALLMRLEPVSDEASEKEDPALKLWCGPSAS